MQAEPASEAPEPVRVKPASDVPASCWDDYVRRNPQGTLCHLRAWLDTVGAAYPYESHSLVAERGGVLCGALPLYRAPVFPSGAALISSPAAIYGGIIADDPAAARALLTSAAELADRFRVRYLELRNRTATGNLQVKNLYVTFRKPIARDPERNMRAIPTRPRTAIRRGIRLGLEAELGGEELLREFYRVYSINMRDLGSPPYPPSFFQGLLRAFGNDCRILIVRHKSRAVGGAAAFFFRNEVLPYWGASIRSAARELCVNDFMYWTLLSRAAERGCELFDFGRSKVGTGAYHFKRHWGFEPTPLPYQYHLVTQKNLPDLSPLNPGFSLPILLWKRMPISITRWLGPKLLRFFP